ncbi:MAG: DUF3810 domain-containing protein [Oscillospiraceae bacterium]|nr:DUF3810 domain-containing protein [Oscillospiraceae bacterium]
MRSKRWIKWAVLAAIPALFTALYFIFSQTKSLADTAVRCFSRPARDALGAVNSIFPFSVMEALYVCGGLWLIVHIVRTVCLAIKKRLGLKRFFSRAGAVLLVFAYIFSGYLSLWGIDYRSSSFSDKESFHVKGVEKDELFRAAEFFTAKAMELADTVKRDSNGLFAENVGEYLSACGTLYDEIETRFPSLKAVSRRPKQMIFSELMSVTGFTGVYFPFTGESNVNVNEPAAFLPATAAHELAHQRGVYSEEEANFIGVTAAVLSDIPAYKYSGCVAASLYLMNALYSSSPELWRVLRSRFDGGFLSDWIYNSEYWQKYESRISAVSEKVYDGYLKANGQEDGIKSYGYCVNHLVSYYELGGYE